MHCFFFFCTPQTLSIIIFSSILRPVIVYIIYFTQTGAYGIITKKKLSFFRVFIFILLFGSTISTAKAYNLSRRYNIFHNRSYSFDVIVLMGMRHTLKRRTSNENLQRLRQNDENVLCTHTRTHKRYVRNLKILFASLIWYILYVSYVAHRPHKLDSDNSRFFIFFVISLVTIV